MNEIQVAPSALAQGVVDSFKAKLKGELLLPGESGYDGARSVWNA